MSKSAIRNKLEQRLNDQIVEATQSITALEEAVEPKEGDCGIGRMLNPDSVPGQATALGTLRLERERLRRLEAARGRLDDFDFAVCRGCGKEIPLERLLLVPETRLCIDCKSPVSS